MRSIESPHGWTDFDNGEDVGRIARNQSTTIFG